MCALPPRSGPVSGGPENDDNVGEPLGDLDGPFRLWGSISGFEALSLAYFREHKEISVLFADLVGFTELAGMLSPRQTLATLHSLWSILDRVSSYLGCHKYEVSAKLSTGSSLAGGKRDWLTAQLA